MACSSGSVQSVADKTIAARQQIERLQNMILSQDASNKERFLALVKENLAKANIKDGRQISYNSDIKTEYTSEFSLDKIANVIIKALKTAAVATDPAIPNPATSPEALAAYSDLVNSVSEAAKSSSSAAASLAFSMTRLSPGMYSFLYATSVNIKDNDTFGSEAVCSTAVYYCFVQSIDDLKNQAEFNLAQLDSAILIKLKTLQAALLDELAKGAIDIATWMSKDAMFDKSVQQAQDRLNAHTFQCSFDKSSKNNVKRQRIPSVAQNVVNAAMKKLSAMGPDYKAALVKTQHRIESDYF